MKTKIFLCTLLMWVTCSATMGQSYYNIPIVTPSGHTLRYDIYNGSACVRGSNGMSGDLIIPNSVTYNGSQYPVLTIKESAFAGMNRLKSVFIPSSVKEIDNNAFDGCDSLESVTLSDSIIYLGDYMFRNCYALSSINLPTHISSIPVGFFQNCTSLSEVTLPNNILSIDSNAFRGCTSITSLKLPNLIFIGKHAFWECTNLDTIYVNSHYTFDDDNIPEYIYSFGEERVSSALRHFSISRNVLADEVFDTNTFIVINYCAYNMYYNMSIWAPVRDRLVQGVFNRATDTKVVTVLSSDSLCGTATATPSEVPCHDSTTLLATANYGYHFVKWHWFGPGNFESYNNPITVKTLYGTYTAYFAPNGYNFNVAVDNIDHGNVTTDGWGLAYEMWYLDTLQITATANYGYHFDQWSDGDTNNPRTITITQDTHLVALFAPNVYTIRTYVDDTLRGSVSGAGNYNYLDTIYITATANYGYHFEQWRTNRDTNNTQMIIVLGDRSFEAQFAPNLYSINTEDNDALRGSVSGAGVYYYLDTTHITATGNYGYHFVQWSDGDTNNPRLITIYGDESITAQFAPNIYAISTYVNDALRGSVSGAGDYNYLSRHTISATANYGYHFTQWSDGNTNNPRTITLTQNTAFTALFAPNVYTLSTAVDDALHGSTTGDGNYNYLSSVQLTSTANYGYHFTQWSDGNTNNPRTITLTQDTTFTAQFAPNVYSLSTAADDTLHGSTAGDGNYNYLSSVQLTSTANYGYHFTQWSDGNANNPRIVTLTQDTAFTAQFAPNVYTLSTAVDDTLHGSTTGDGDYNYLSQHTITATANYGYHFSQWSDGNTNNPRTITLTQNTAFTALFAPNVYSLSTAVDDTLHGSTTGDGSYNYLSSVQLTSTANYGYHFTQWSDGNTNNPRTITIMQDTTFTALFAPNVYSLSTAVDDALHGSTTGDGDYNYLSQHTISATANYGYHFSQWSDGDTNNPRTVTLTQDTAFTAQFAPNVYSLSTTVNDTLLGTVSAGGVYEYLDSATVEAQCTAAHYHFVSWSNGVRDNPYTFTMRQDTLLTAVFAIDTHRVQLAVSEAGYGHAEGDGLFSYGMPCTVTATAEAGYHFVQWSNGERDNPLTLTVVQDTLLTAQFIADVTPDICMVSVQEEHNVVVWNKADDTNIASYSLYRESNTAGDYDLVAHFSYDSLSLWTDTSSRPMTRSYRYRLTATDRYGYESEPSTIHKTMHLTISQGIGGRWNLVWTEYWGADYTTYVIYRGTSPTDIEQIDELPAGGNTTYTDEHAPGGAVYYQVGVVMSNECSPTAKAYAISRSNMATNNTVGVPAVREMEPGRITVQGQTLVVEGLHGETVRLYDLLGRLLHTEHDGGSGRVVLQAPSTGTYLLHVEGYKARKVVVLH